MLASDVGWQTAPGSRTYETQSDETYMIHETSEGTRYQNMPSLREASAARARMLPQTTGERVNADHGRTVQAMQLQQRQASENRNGVGGDRAELEMDIVGRLQQLQDLQRLGAIDERQRAAAVDELLGLRRLGDSFADKP
jgi:hypothetical protein|eukprot:SAG25_NODE_41_length_19492_cov_407.631671_20_plen_140_part_00